jgi:hypothetical protein
LLPSSLDRLLGFIDDLHDNDRSEGFLIRDGTVERYIGISGIRFLLWILPDSGGIVRVNFAVHDSRAMSSRDATWVFPTLAIVLPVLAGDRLGSRSGKAAGPDCGCAAERMRGCLREPKEVQGLDQARAR